MESKLHDVKGRVDYISSPKRQENLYAVFSNVEDSYWDLLAEQNQRDFAKSGTEGNCIEARELIIMLPPSLIDYNHEILLKYITSKFLEKYDVGCCAALHHNKSKTNLHIHLIFSEREIRQEVERKTASRNMFYNESGKHVRTKKEILDKDGNLRSGCKIIKKGEVYETNFFQPKKEKFKSHAFLENIKQVMTDAINEIVKDENEKLQVFQKGGPYLATKKIGKNNPKSDEIKVDNYLRQEWNRNVDRALLTGASEAEVMTATFALSSGVISTVGAAIVTGIETKNVEETLKAAALAGSESFKWGAIVGVVTGGVSETVSLAKSARSNPTPRESELKVLERTKGAEEQISYLDGVEVSSATKGATRPDVVVKNADGSIKAIEVKNYNLASSNSRSVLYKETVREVTDRVNNLPPGSTQEIILDVRGRGFSKDVVDNVVANIQSRCASVYKDIPVTVMSY